MSINAQGQENKREPAYTDTDKITFGKYRGILLQDVPPSYLAWLWDNNVSDDMVRNYIWNSRNAINLELKEKRIR